MNKDNKDQRDYSLRILECLSLPGFIFLPYPHLLLPEVAFFFFLLATRCLFFELQVMAYYKIITHKIMFK